VVIKVFFAVLVLCTAAVVAVILAVHFRVKRHLQEQTVAAADSRPASEPAEATEGVPVRSTEESSSTPSS
jgi:hypothetical protein